MELANALPWAALAATLAVLVAVDLRVLGSRGEPSLRAAGVWSAVWVGVGLGAALALLAWRGGADAGLYVGVYVVERTLSLDNVFVFLAIFAWFGVRGHERTRVLTWAIVGALALRIVAIVAGVAIVERFEFVLYVLGALLVVLAWRMFTGRREHAEPGENRAVRVLRRRFPVTEDHAGGRFAVSLGGRRHLTPLALCLAAALVADLVFAVDSIPSAFAITRDPFLIVMGNAFALLGLRALFSLSEILVARLRYLDRTIAVLLAAIGVKLMLEGVVHVSPGASVAGIAAILAAGIGASIAAERRERAALRRRPPSADPVPRTPPSGGSGAPRASAP